MPRTTVTTTVRAKPDLFEAIDALAEAEDRSRNGQIVHMLRRALSQHSGGNLATRVTLGGANVTDPARVIIAFTDGLDNLRRFAKQAQRSPAASEDPKTE